MGGWGEAPDPHCWSKGRAERRSRGRRGRGRCRVRSPGDDVVDSGLSLAADGVLLIDDQQWATAGSHSTWVVWEVGEGPGHLPSQAVRRWARFRPSSFPLGGPWTWEWRIIVSVCLLLKGEESRWRGWVPYFIRFTLPDVAFLAHVLAAPAGVDAAADEMYQPARCPRRVIGGHDAGGQFTLSRRVDAVFEPLMNDKGPGCR